MGNPVTTGTVQKGVQTTTPAQQNNQTGGTAQTQKGAATQKTSEKAPLNGETKAQEAVQKDKFEQASPKSAPLSKDGKSSLTQGSATQTISAPVPATVGARPETTTQREDAAAALDPRLKGDVSVSDVARSTADKFTAPFQDLKELITDIYKGAPKAAPADTTPAPSGQAGQAVSKGAQLPAQQSKGEKAATPAQAQKGTAPAQQSAPKEAAPAQQTTKGAAPAQQSAPKEAAPAQQTTKGAAPAQQSAPKEAAPTQQSNQTSQK